MDEFERLAAAAIKIEHPDCKECGHAWCDHGARVEDHAFFCEAPEPCRLTGSYLPCPYTGPTTADLLKAQVADAMRKVAGLPAEGGVPKVTQFMASGSGARACGFRVGDLNVLVTPSSDEGNDLAMATAKRYSAGEGYCDTCGGGHGLTTNPICVGCHAALRERQSSASSPEPALGALTNKEIHDILTMTLHGDLPHKTMQKVFHGLHELSERRSACRPPNAATIALVEAQELGHCQHIAAQSLPATATWAEQEVLARVLFAQRADARRDR